MIPIVCQIERIKSERRTTEIAVSPQMVELHTNALRTRVHNSASPPQILERPDDMK